ncbi:hypothetical protein [Gaetbulibacter sp. PBL-D1]|uniref:hypothetical protein n=1 Tax=Gaetbulibacter sp. PBL-D1 TaxID=3422594 RepID=UPI003D2F18C6
MSYVKLIKTLADGLKTAYKTSEDDIINILPENEENFDETKFLEAFLKLDKDRIEAIGQKGKDKFTEGYNKAKKEERVAFEKEIKDTFDIDEDLIGIDLVKKVVELKSETSKKGAGKLSDDEIKSHPTVIKLLTEKEKAHKDDIQKIKEDNEQVILGMKKERVFGNVSKKALALLDEMNPVLSENPKVANNQRNYLLDRLKGYDWQPTENDDDYIPLKDGKRVEDAHGHGISFNDLVKGAASDLYDFKQSDKRDTPPGGGSGGGSGSGNHKFKSEDEYAAYVTDTSIPLADRQKAKEDWNKQ